MWLIDDIDFLHNEFDKPLCIPSLDTYDRTKLQLTARARYSCRFCKSYDTQPCGGLDTEQEIIVYCRNCSEVDITFGEYLNSVLG